MPEYTYAELRVLWGVSEEATRAKVRRGLTENRYEVRRDARHRGKVYVTVPDEDLAPSPFGGSAKQLRAEIERLTTVITTLEADNAWLRDLVGNRVSSAQARSA